jgi:hypothetical protein
MMTTVLPERSFTATPYVAVPFVPVRMPGRIASFYARRLAFRSPRWNTLAEPRVVRGVPGYQWRLFAR